jgi:hypothetical protein
MKGQVIHKELSVGRARLSGHETGELDPVRGIVHSFEQGEPLGVTVFKPRMDRSIHLDELAEGGPARASLSVPAALSLRSPQSLGYEPAAEGMSTQGADVGIAAEMLGQQCGGEVVEVGLPGPGQGPKPDLILDPPVRRPAPTPMDHGLIAFLQEAGQEAAEMPRGKAKAAGTF